MSAVRYTRGPDGELVIRMRIVESGHRVSYRTTIRSSPPGLSWTGTIGAAPASRLAIDSTRAFDEIARSAIAFAADDESDFLGYLEQDEGGYVSVRSSRWAMRHRDRVRSLSMKRRNARRSRRR